MAANLHVFTPAQLAAMAADAGYRDVSLSTTYFCTTLLLAASYVTHGRRDPGWLGGYRGGGWKRSHAPWTSRWPTEYCPTTGATPWSVYCAAEASCDGAGMMPMGPSSCWH
jgi:hypothetical protein